MQCARIIPKPSLPTVHGNPGLHETGSRCQERQRTAALERGGSSALWHPDFSPGTLISDSWLQNGESINLCCWSHWACGNLSQQPQEMNTPNKPTKKCKTESQSDGMRWHLGCSEAHAGLVKWMLELHWHMREVSRPQVIPDRGVRTTTHTYTHTHPHKPVLEDSTIRKP